MAETMSKETAVNGIIELVGLVVDKLNPTFLRLFPMRSHEILVALREVIKHEYLEVENEKT